MDGFTGVYLLLLLLGLFVLILWIFLPFAVFGVKDKLNQLIAQGKANNETLQELVQEFRAIRTRQRPPQ